MIFQDREGYQIAKDRFAKGNYPIHTLFKKQFFDSMKEEFVHRGQTFGKPQIIDSEQKILGMVKALGHHDEYITVLNLQNLELEMCFGLSKVLGFDEKEEETWTFKNQCNLIHDDYFPLYWTLGILTNQVLQERKYKLEPFGQRYIINIPLKKKNGGYVWVKQLSIPISIDEQGHMVRQLNSYTVVCRYEGVSLPILPRIFFADGTRAREAERYLFEILVKKSLLHLTETQMRVVQAALKIWQEKIQATNEDKVKKHLEFDLVRHRDIADRMAKDWPKAHGNISPGTVRNHVDEIRGNLEISFNIKFPTSVEIALFLKNLYLLQ